MNTQKTISYNTKFMADAVGYDNYNIIQSVIPTREHRKTCTLETLHNWIKSNHNMIVDVQHDDSQLWGYVLWDCRSDELMHIDNDSMFETDEIAFEKGLQRALYEIKCNKK